MHYIISTDAHPQHRIMCDVNSTEALLEELSLPWTVKLKSITEGAQIDLEEDLPFSQSCIKSAIPQVRGCVTMLL
ncbi:MAG: hypothetical protein H6925_03615 [Holosporaceae bacterium]|nr:MAG: hypothetical protein H6925_03615 [Holosporaceae bacterium]